MTSLSESLSKWYFSEEGGLFLTDRGREFYFAFQDLLRTVGALSDWSCCQRPSDPDKLFLKLLEGIFEKDKHEIVKKRGDEKVKNWPKVIKVLKEKNLERMDDKEWRKVCRSVSKKFYFLGKEEK